ncbi:MAG: dUTP diphosphatase [Boseongicola sp.]|nr:dUTP diphosphatase [Boseongicola sp.]NNJ68958.1 dUTP diphosphatase [Boseongicola sp.]
MGAVVKIRRLEGFDTEIALPRYETAGAAGADIRANFPQECREGVVLGPGARVLVPTGFSICLPTGYEAQIRPRSGLALKHGITLANTPGTVDADYRGPVGVIVINLGHESFKISHGDRIAQMIVAPVIQAQFESVDDLSETVRGSGGFGSTGQG